MLLLRWGVLVAVFLEVEVPFLTIRDDADMKLDTVSCL